MGIAAEAMIRHLGGPAKFSAALFEESQKARPSSQNRLNVLQTIIRMYQTEELLRAAQPLNPLLSQEDLARRLRQEIEDAVLADPSIAVQVAADFARPP